MGKQMGRPPKPEADRRYVIVSLRLRAQELKQIDAAARAQGENRSDWIRRVLAAAARTTR